MFETSPRCFLHFPRIFSLHRVALQFGNNMEQVSSYDTSGEFLAVKV